MNWLMKQINRIRTWWNNNHTNIEHDVEQGIRRLVRRMNIIVDNSIRLIFIGVIINVIASDFYPEFPERFPVIYGWFDGWLQLGEFAVKAGIAGTYALFTGHWSEFWAEYSSATTELIQQFVNWLGTLHF